MTLTHDFCTQYGQTDRWFRETIPLMNGKRFKIIETALAVLAVVVINALVAYALSLGADPTYLPMAAIVLSAALLGVKGAEVLALLGAFRDGVSASLEASQQSNDQGGQDRE